jgi:IPT/TIG domain-containing protein
MALGTSLPYGLRDVQLIQYPDLGAATFGSVLTDLPNSRTFSFNDTEEFNDLRGDDKLVTSHGQGAQVEWELESGGISFEAWAVLSGATVISTGITPNQVKRVRKKSSDQRPFFTVVGRSISDSGGDFSAIVYLCRSTGNLEAELGDGEFLIPQTSGIGFPCRVTGLVNATEILDTVYDFVQRETIGSIAAPVLDTPSVPVVYSLSDTGGPIAGGEIIRVSGYNFNGITAVTVGATAATDWEVISPYMLELITPAHSAGAAVVVITNPTGASATGAFSTYTYV